jgi:hypothetical protein
MANHDRGNDGRFTRTEQTAENDSRAVRLRAQGAPYSAIAKALGYSDPSGAYRAVQRALTAVPAPDVEQLRLLQGEELDMIQVEAWQVVKGRHLKVSNSGRIALDPLTQEPLTDPAPKVAALGVLLRAADRRAKLYGLDAPTQARVDVAMISPETAWGVIDAEVARLHAAIEAEERGQLPPGHPG